MRVKGWPWRWFRHGASTAPLAAQTGRRCGDCGAVPGTPHEDGCDVARCLRSGQQRIQCPAQDSGFHDCGQDVWTGMWPGEAECREWGWFVYWTDPADGEQYGSWTQCGPDDPKARPNLNRLHEDAHWDAQTGRWQLGPCDHADSTDHVVIAADEDGDAPDVLRECNSCGLLTSAAFMAAIGYPLPTRPDTAAEVPDDDQTAG